MAAPLYKPPTRVSTLTIPWEAQVTRADPNWARFKYYEIEYEMTRRPFFANPYTHGPYSGTWDNPIIAPPGSILTEGGDVIFTEGGDVLIAET